MIQIKRQIYWEVSNGGKKENLHKTPFDLTEIQIWISIIFHCTSQLLGKKNQSAPELKINKWINFEWN